MEQIKHLAQHYFSTVVEYRRHFHRYPELSGHEKNTAVYITNILETLRIPYRDHFSGFGIVALLKGRLPGKGTVALRAEMDALPLREISDKPYRSYRDGVMHACGHDAHMAMLLGALHILHDLKDTFGGTVKVIFQPSEEEYDGGAPFMIEEGVLENPDVNVIFGQHVTPGIPSGSIGLREGNFMASTDEIHIKIIGRGGHAALIGDVINPVEMGMELLDELRRFVKENQPQDSPTVLAFGRFIAEGLTNLIPGSAQMAGTLRTFNEKWREEVIQNIEKTAHDTAARYGGSCEVTIRRGYPVLVNDPETARRVRNYAESYLGAEQVWELPHRMTAEDFAYYLEKRPGTFYRLGTSPNVAGPDKNLHSPDFDIDETSLKAGMGLLSWITVNELKRITAE